MIRYNLFFFAVISLILTSCGNDNSESTDYHEPTAAVAQSDAPIAAQPEIVTEPAVATGKPIYLNTEGFLTQVHDFKASKALNFQSELKKEMATTGFVVNIILLTGVFFFFINESPELWKKYPKTIVLITLALAVLLYIGRHELLKVGKGGSGGGSCGSCGSGCGGE